MKKITAFLTAMLFLTVAVSVVSAEENLGFIQRMKNRFAKKPAQAGPVAKTISTPKTVASSVTAKPKIVNKAPIANVKDTPIQREGLIDNIKQMLDADPEVILNMADLKVTRDKDKASYTFKGESLESLNDESLQNLANNITGEVGRLRTNSVNEQMNVVRQAQQVQAQMNQIQQSQTAARQVAQIQAIPKGPPAGTGAPSIPNGGRGATGGPGGPGGPGSAGGRR
ncbi:MAG: hypothetical protein WCK38_01705 [Candidatus Omnitrophota bacterium]